MIQIKSTSTLLFAVLLTGWVHFTSGQPSLSKQPAYIDFLNRLEEAIDASPPDLLPFSLKLNVIQGLRLTANEFKRICLVHDFELSRSSTYSPIMALSNAINDIFSALMRSTSKDSDFLHILEKIKSMDPIGFNVYLTQQNFAISRKNPSQRTIQAVIDFEAITSQRVRLLNMKTNDSSFEIFDQSNSSTPFNFLPQKFSISPTARDEIATEYGPLSEVSIDQFTNLVTAKMSRKMYRVGTDNLDDYRPYFSTKLSDVQILYDIFSRQTSHAICICYKPLSCMVHVYDSLMRKRLDDRQNAIIQKLYPFYKSIIFKKAKFLQDKFHPTGAIFAITYASMLLLNEDPAKIPIKLNKVVGDETLFMRIHILNMLASQKLAFLE